ncbi:hypothetical protein DFR70_113120 [Nocardia tenerifensis]|uniref:Uncharacterized protein n=1 Tax=Nocardia tenerifensis TaxID=228006 RepID=A0A318JS22_9NOCA|nr:DUF6882 domain-containing protein [Nocardia tenerifensis]PXX58785.1 hypothetical protein DFR70_113120 [Nocardia tenerifensis]
MTAYLDHESPTLEQLLDDAALMSFEHQEHCMEILGEHRWQVGYEPPRFEFFGDHPLRCKRFHVLGTAAPGPRSWLWSWANNDWYPPEVTELARSVRDYGLRHGISALSTAEVPFAELPGSPAEPNRAAWLMGELAKAVSGSWTWYSCDVGHGTRLAVLLEHPDLEPPTPDLLRTTHVLNSVFTLALPDHRRAIHSYAIQRGLNPAFADDKLLLTAPNTEITIAFAPSGLVTAISSSTGTHPAS